MLEMDQILKANELSIALVAAIPALIFASLGVYGLVRWLRPVPPDPRVEALPCRQAQQTDLSAGCVNLASSLPPARMLSGGYAASWTVGPIGLAMRLPEHLAAECANHKDQGACPLT